jgi:hypothetical protein
MTRKNQRLQREFPQTRHALDFMLRPLRRHHGHYKWSHGVSNEVEIRFVPKAWAWPQQGKTS